MQFALLRRQDDGVDEATKRFRGFCACFWTPMIVSVKRVNELDFYSLGLKDLADKIKISQPRALALVKHLNLQGSSEFFKVVQIGGVQALCKSSKLSGTAIAHFLSTLKCAARNTRATLAEP